MVHLFSLTSWGNSGVPWLAKCLNLHPSIRAFVNARPALGEIAGESLGASEYLRHLVAISNDQYPLCGDVHGIGPHEFTELSGTFGDRFHGAHLTGHPVQRFAGSLAISKEMGRHWSHQDFLKIWSLDRNSPLSSKLLSILGENGDHVPASYMMHVNAIRILAASAPLARIEELMQSDESWRRLVSHLSDGTVTDFGDHWRRLDGVFIGVAHEPFKRAPRAVWETFPTNTARVFAAMLTDEARSAYQDLGYDLSFVE